MCSTGSGSNTMDTLSTGTKAYMSLYPEKSTDGGLRLGNVVPDFSAETTHGPIESFHEWKKGKWAILFSHPADFTPVCTTEIGRLALKYDELVAMDCLVATLSVDPVKSHQDWLRDVVAHCENKIEVKFPIIGDADRKISEAYGMIDAGTSDAQDLPLTIRAVFIINPDNKLMLSLNYPACVGRNMDEIVRCVKALQVSCESSRVEASELGGPFSFLLNTAIISFSTFVPFSSLAAFVSEEYRDARQLAQQSCRDCPGRWFAQHGVQGICLPASYRFRRRSQGDLPRLSHVPRTIGNPLPSVGQSQ